MKTREECVNILGEEKVSKVEAVLFGKDINKETVEHVLNYLALSKLTFPYLDNDETTARICGNLMKSISHNSVATAMEQMFTGKFYIGLSHGDVVEDNMNLVKIILPKSKFNIAYESVICHELDHVATTRFVKFTKEEYKQYLKQLKSDFEELFDVNVKIEDFDDYVNHVAEYEYKRWINGKKVVRDYITLKRTGINGDYLEFHKFKNFGSEFLNEGITAYKMKMMDKVAGRGGMLCQSGYILNEEFTKWFANIIGEEELIKLQNDGNFVGILKRFKQKTGMNGKQLRDLFIRCDQNKNKRKKVFRFYSMRNSYMYAKKNKLTKELQTRWDNIVGKTEEDVNEN